MVSSLDKARPSHRSTSSRSSRARSPALWTEWSGIVQLPHQNNGFGPCPSTLAFLSNYCGFPTGISTVPISEDCTRIVPAGGGGSPLEGGGRPGTRHGLDRLRRAHLLQSRSDLLFRHVQRHQNVFAVHWSFRPSRPPLPAFLAWDCAMPVSQRSPWNNSAAPFSVRASRSAESSKSGLKRSPPLKPASFARYCAAFAPAVDPVAGPAKGPARVPVAASQMSYRRYWATCAARAAGNAVCWLRRRIAGFTSVICPITTMELSRNAMTPLPGLEEANMRTPSYSVASPVNSAKA